MVSTGGTWWILEAKHVPYEFMTLVSIFCGWGSILVLLALVPLLNLVMGVRKPPEEPAPVRRTTRPYRRPSRPRSQHHRRAEKTGRGTGQKSGQQNSPKPRTDGNPQYRVSQPDTAKDGKTTQRLPSDGEPRYRTSKRAGDGTPRYRDDTPAASTRGSRGKQGDGEPKYRDKPASEHRPRGDSDPVYRSDG
jgi:hypothetical protein